MPAGPAAPNTTPDAVSSAPVAATAAAIVPGPGPAPEVLKPAIDPAVQPTPPATEVPGGAASPVIAPPSSPTPTAFDQAALRQALDTFVGAEPAKTTGQAFVAEASAFKTRQAIQAVYAARGFAPFWIEDGRFGAKARSVLARIDRAAEDGLDLKTYAVPIPHGDDAASLVRAELALTDAAVAYGRQATGSRVDPARIGALIAAKPDVADPARVLATVSAAADAGDALHALNPPQAGYALLKAKLAELRQATEVAGQAPIPYGPNLKLGMRDPRVPLIRARFGLDTPNGADEAAGLVYDTKVAAAVANFQKLHHLPASGILTIRTVSTMSGGNPRRLEDEIIANMEVWRWLPRDLGANHVEVNIPDFTARVMHGDAVAHETRVVVGQPDKPTPVFSQTMRFIIVNPYWNVPLSIVKKEMLPKLAADPSYFEDHGYETVERDGITYVRQPPGETNALGRIKFMFPNQYSVYLHDTNARALFGRDSRAFSHGCVRVEAPFKFAEAVLGRDHGWTEARVKKLIGGSERTINLPEPLPIHIVYFTAFVDGTGKLQLRDDVYGYASKTKAALGLQS